jgi:hypothetical protein
VTSPAALGGELCRWAREQCGGHRLYTERGIQAVGGLAFGFGLVQGHGGANESLQRFLVYLLALAEVDGAPRVPVKTGVEEARRSLSAAPLAKVIFTTFR